MQHIPIINFLNLLKDFMKQLQQGFSDSMLKAGGERF